MRALCLFNLREWARDTQREGTRERPPDAGGSGEVMAASGRGDVSTVIGAT